MREVLPPEYMASFAGWLGQETAECHSSSIGRSDRIPRHVRTKHSAAWGRCRTEDPRDRPSDGRTRCMVQPASLAYRGGGARFVVEGEVVLAGTAGEEMLQTGDSAGFPPGKEFSHHLQNRSSKRAVILKVGPCNLRDDVSYYPALGLRAMAADHFRFDDMPYQLFAWTALRRMSKLSVV
jgi:hypothetical protein